MPAGVAVVVLVEANDAGSSHLRPAAGNPAHEPGQFPAVLATRLVLDGIEIPGDAGLRRPGLGFVHDTFQRACVVMPGGPRRPIVESCASRARRHPWRRQTQYPTRCPVQVDQTPHREPPLHLRQHQFPLPSTAFLVQVSCRSLSSFRNSGTGASMQRKAPNGPSRPVRRRTGRRPAKERPRHARSWVAVRRRSSRRSTRI